LRIALVDELRRLASFGSYVWAVTDPATEVAIAPLADVPSEAVTALPRLIRLRYLTTVNRWTSLETTAESLHRATSGHPDLSLLHRELLAGIGVGDIATVVFRDQNGLWGWLDLWRTLDEPPFGDHELERLSAVTAPITAALRRCLALTFGQPASVPDRPGPIVLVLSPASTSSPRLRTRTAICGRSFHRAATAGRSPPGPTTCPPSCLLSRRASTITLRRRASAYATACG